MQIGFLIATVFQTICFYALLWFLLPIHARAKQCALYVGIGAVFVAAAGAVSYLLYPIFLVKYGYFFIAAPSHLLLYLLSGAKGVRFLFIVLTAMISHQILGVPITVIRIYQGFSLFYFTVNIVSYGFVIYLAYRFKEQFHKIIFAYKKEFYYLSSVVLLLFSLIRMFTPITAPEVIDFYNLTVSGLLFLLTACVYSYIIISFQTLSKRYDLETENLLWHNQLSEATAQISFLEQSSETAVLYRHDMRHHFSLIKGYLSQGDTEKIEEYLSQSIRDIDTITPKAYCENKMLNLLLSSYEKKADELSICLSCNMEVTEYIAIPDTDLCSVLSNLLENAIHATSKVEVQEDKRIYLNCRIHKNRLLIEVENPFVGSVVIKDGLPQANEPGHGYGTKSIAHIAEKRKGFLNCEAVGQMFVARVALGLWDSEDME